MNYKIVYTIIGILFSSWTILAQDYRYTETLFSFSEIDQDASYSSAPFLDAPYTIESNTTIDDLKMDIFFPGGDSNTNRPAIIFAHGGGFILGNKNHDDMMAFCDSLAKKGYVTATIDYRQGFNPLNNANLHSIRAVYRGVQDGRSAIRHMRANAEEYGVDPSKVYFVGSSAGAFIGLHSMYINDENEIPSETGTIDYTNITFPFNHTSPDLGALDIGDYLSFDGEPDALVSLWGAIQNTNLISSDNDKAVMLIHGGTDVIVPFEVGYPFSYPALDDVYGSNEISLELGSLGLTNFETYFVPNEGHEFYGVTNGNWSNGTNGNAYWDIIFDKIVQFLWKQHKPTASFTYTSDVLNLDFEDESLGAISWLWDFGDGTTSTEQNPSHSYAQEGNYEVKLYIENDILSWDETTMTVSTGVVSINEKNTSDFTYYPNPSDGIVSIDLKQVYSLIKLKIFNLSGQLIQETEFQNSSGIICDLSELTPDIYLIKLDVGERNYTLKTVKN